jgi:hypothetical protein
MPGNFFSVYVDNGVVRNTAKSKNKALIHPIQRDIEIPFVPNPANVIPQGIVGSDIIIAGRNGHFDVVFKEAIVPFFTETLFHVRLFFESPNAIKGLNLPYLIFDGI